MPQKELIEKRLQELKTLRYLKRHNADIKKIYSDVNCDMLIRECYYQIECQDTTFQHLTDSEYTMVQNMFA